MHTYSKFEVWLNKIMWFSKERTIWSYKQVSAYSRTEEYQVGTYFSTFSYFWTLWDFMHLITDQNTNAISLANYQ